MIYRLQLPARDHPLMARRHSLLGSLALRLRQFIDLRVHGLNPLPRDLVIEPHILRALHLVDVSVRLRRLQISGGRRANRILLRRDDHISPELLRRLQLIEDRLLLLLD